MMKANITRLLSILLITLLVLTACTPAEPSDTPTEEPTKAETEAGDKTPEEPPPLEGEGDVWNLEGWPEHPLGIKIPGWEFLPAISDEFKFRQTDPSIKREKEGNMYKKGWPLVDEPVTITALGMQHPNIIDITTGHYLMENLEKQTNVHIEWQLIPASSWNEGRNMAIASDNLTDIIIGGGFSKSEQLLYGEQQGIFVDLKPYLTDEYTLYISHLFKERPDMLEYITTPQGKVFALFSNACNYHVSMAKKMWVNTEWLKNLNLKKPNTIDEFTDMLRAFRDKDPNGNGEQDELPLVGSPKGWNTRIDDFLVNAFTYHPPGYLVAYDDVVTMSVIQDGYKEALRYINSLYKEDLVDKDSFVRDAESLQGLGLANSSYDIIGAFPGGYYGAAGYDIDHTDPRSNVWEPISPLEGPNGLRVVWKDPFGSLAEGQFVVTKAAENPALCVRWIDSFYCPRFDAGIQGEDWVYAEEGVMNLFGDTQAYYRTIDDKLTADVANKRVENMGFPYAYISFDQRAMKGAVEGDYDALMYAWTKEYYEPYAMENVGFKYIPADFFVPLDEVEAYNTAKVAIAEYVNEMSTKFMVGEVDLDQEWDTYINTIKELGLDIVLKHAQAAYNSYYGLN